MKGREDNHVQSDQLSRAKKKIYRKCIFLAAQLPGSLFCQLLHFQITQANGFGEQLEVSDLERRKAKRD